MPANLPNSPYSANIQGPDPTGQLGYPLAVVGVSGGVAQSVSIDHTIPGDTDLTNSRLSNFRYNTQLYRSGVATVDKLAIPASVTVADVAVGGSLLAGTTYNCTMAAGNQWGPTTVPANGSVTTAADASNTHVARVTTAQVTNATWYDVFLSTAANPLWVARITEAQRAAGCTVTAVGTVTGTSPGANKVDIQVVGTGLASNVNPFANNNAFTPTLVTPIDMTGFQSLIVQYRLNVTDLRSLPSVRLTIFENNTLAPNDWFSVLTTAPGLLTAPGNPLEFRFIHNAVAGNTVILVDTIAGQGASVDIWTARA